MRIIPRFFAWALLVGLLLGLVVGEARASEFYRNAFDGPDALTGLVVSAGPNGGSVEVSDGQLLARGGSGAVRGAYAAIPLARVNSSNPSGLFGLRTAGHKVVWAFNLSNFDAPGGGRNNGFHVHLASTVSDPDGPVRVAYSLRGGIYADDRIRFLRTAFVPGQPPSSGVLAEFAAEKGLAILPLKGSFRVEYLPASSVWVFYASYGSEYTDPMRVVTQIGSVSDQSGFLNFTSFSHMAFESENGGGVMIDNLTVARITSAEDDPTPPEQQIRFDFPQTLVFTTDIIPVSATASSGLPVTIELHSGPATLKDGWLTLTGVGTVVLVARQPGAAPYDAAPDVFRHIEVSPRPVGVTFSGLSQPYSGGPRVIGAESDPPGVPLRVRYSGQETGPVAVGNYPVLAESDSPNHTASAEAVLTITKAPLRVSPAPVSRLAGMPNPAAYPLRYDTLFGGDTPADLHAIPVGSTAAKASSPPGFYPITLTGGLDETYEFVLVPGSLEVVGFGGSYEALLTAPGAAGAPDGVPVGKLEITVSTTRPAFTGRLTLLDEPEAIAVSGGLDGPDTDGYALGVWSYRRAAKGARPARALVLSLKLDATRLEARLGSGESPASVVPFAASDEGAPLYRVRFRVASPWGGAHTLLAREPVPVDAEDERPYPTVAAYATGSISAASGVLTLKGKLGDGVGLASTTKPDVEGRHRLLARPYGSRLDSSLAGRIDLVVHPVLAGRHRVVADDGVIHWTKTALPPASKTKDATHREGFGPLAVSVSLDPWLPPVSATRATKTSPAVPAITLADRLGLVGGTRGPGGFELVYGPGELVPLPPGWAVLGADGRVSVAPEHRNWTMKFTPGTGTLSGSFRVVQPTGVADKTVTRTVKFSGVLRQRSAAMPEGGNEGSDEDTVIGVGSYSVPPPPGAVGGESMSGEIRLQHFEEPAP